MADGERSGNLGGQHDTVWFVALQAHEVLDSERFQQVRDDIKELKGLVSRVGWGVIAASVTALLNLLASNLHIGIIK